MNRSIISSPETFASSCVVVPRWLEIWSIKWKLNGRDKEIRVYNSLDWLVRRFSSITHVLHLKPRTRLSSMGDVLLMRRQATEWIYPASSYSAIGLWPDDQESLRSETISALVIRAGSGSGLFLAGSLSPSVCLLDLSSSLSPSNSSRGLIPHCAPLFFPYHRLTDWQSEWIRSGLSNWQSKAKKERMANKRIHISSTLNRNVCGIPFLGCNLSAGRW